MMNEHAGDANSGTVSKLKPVIENLSIETRQLANARLLNVEEAEAVATFLGDMRDQLQRLERAETGKVDVAGNVAVAYYELEGMVKMLKSDLEIARSRMIS